MTDINTEQGAPITKGSAVNPIIESVSYAFRRRIAAFLVDWILLFFIGSQLLNFGPITFFASLESFAPLLIGFPIAFLYFGLLNSAIFKGQTLGKRWLKVKVVDRSGKALSLNKSFLRSLACTLPVFLSGIILPIDNKSQAFAASLLLMWFFFLSTFGSVYLFLFNRRTRQCLHDLVASSVVIPASLKEMPKIQSLWRPHLYIVLGSSLLLIVLQSTGPIDVGNQLNFGQMQTISDKIKTDPMVLNVGLAEVFHISNTPSEGSKTTNNIQVTIITPERFTEEEIHPLNLRVYKQVCQAYQGKLNHFDQIKTIYHYQVNIGISSFKYERLLHSPVTICNKLISPPSLKS